MAGPTRRSQAVYSVGTRPRALDRQASGTPNEGDPACDVFEDCQAGREVMREILTQIAAALDGIEGLLNDWLRARSIAARAFGLAYKELRRNRKKRGSGGSHTREQWQALKAFYDFTCLRCARREPEIRLTRDHIKPLSRKGTDFIDNIQPLCEECGTWKADATIDYRISPIAQEAARRAAARMEGTHQ
jgi:hypothetical protein